MCFSTKNQYRNLFKKNTTDLLESWTFIPKFTKQGRHCQEHTEFLPFRNPMETKQDIVQKFLITFIRHLKKSITIALYKLQWLSRQLSSPILRASTF